MAYKPMWVVGAVERKQVLCVRRTKAAAIKWARQACCLVSGGRLKFHKIGPGHYYAGNARKNWLWLMDNVVAKFEGFVISLEVRARIERQQKLVEQGWK